MFRLMKRHVVTTKFLNLIREVIPLVNPLGNFPTLENKQFIVIYSRIKYLISGDAKYLKD